MLSKVKFPVFNKVRRQEDARRSGVAVPRILNAIIDK